MNENIILTILEFVSSVIVEGIILSGVFMWLSNKATKDQQQNLQSEMNNIETQNKLIFEQLQKEIRESKREIISQVKESNEKPKVENPK